MKRKIIQIDEDKCDACGLCAEACHEGAIAIVDGKARLVSDSYCDGLGDCLGECPQGAITIIEREAEDYDEAAVKARIAERSAQKTAPASGCPSGACPSAKLMNFARKTAEELKKEGPSTNSSSSNGESQLSHWPLLLNLVPPNAPFLKGADLLIAATCTAFSHGSFHQEFIKDHALVVTCPKFEDPVNIKERLSAIMARGGIRSVTVVTMEVPCCGALARMADQCLDETNFSGGVEHVVLTLDGQIKSKNYENRNLKLKTS